MTMRRRDFLGLTAGAVLAECLPAQAQRERTRVLYVTHSAGFRHESIPVSRAVLAQLASTTGTFAVSATEEFSEFAPERLARYGAVMFFTTGELPMSDTQKRVLLDFVAAGGGFLGVHSATDTFYEWPDYHGLIGGTFDQHPWHQSVRIDVVDPADPLVAFLGRSLQIEDEIYQIRDFDAAGSRVLLRLDPSSVDVTKEGTQQRPYGWPLAWARAYGRGRVFYTALGHEEAVWRDQRFQQLLINAIAWAGRRSP
jgi:uncharacterized protein